MIKFKTIDFQQDLEEYIKSENEAVKYISLGYNMKVPDKPFIAILDADLQELNNFEEFLNKDLKRTYQENLFLASFGYQPKLVLSNFEKFQKGKQHLLTPSLTESNGYFLYNHQVEHFCDFVDTYPPPLINKKLKFRRDLNKKSDVTTYDYLKIGNLELTKYIKKHRLFDFTYYANVKGAYRLGGFNF
jgi:hypothetical protein